MNLADLIGKEVTAIGDCGMKKDQLVRGILTSIDQHETIIDNGRYLISVNPKTVKEKIAEHLLSYYELSEDLKEIAREIHPNNYTEYNYKPQGVEIAFSCR